MKKILLTLSIILSSLSLNAFSNEKSIEFTVMHGAGGVSDVTSRYIANNLNNGYIVVNRPGGSGRIALTHLFREHTMLLATMTHVFVTNPINFQDLDHNPKQDFDTLAVVGVMPSALVCNKKTGFKNFNDFLKTNKEISFGFGGFGGFEHIATELLVKETKIKSIMIPYAQGGSKPVADMIGGHIDCMFANYPTIKSQIDSENLILLMTSHNLGYNVPSWNSFYKKEFPFQSYLSIIVPSSMNVDTKNKIVSDLRNTFKKPNFNKGLEDLGVFPLAITDKNKIKEIVNYMDTIRNFILENNIKTKE
jgi:tripartite-type tricarboxylate transporter receptor subunit TctC